MIMTDMSQLKNTTMTVPTSRDNASATLVVRAAREPQMGKNKSLVATVPLGGCKGSMSFDFTPDHVTTVSS